MVIFRVIAVCGKRIYVFCNGTTSGSYLSWIYSHDSGFSLWYLYCAEHADFRWGKEWIFTIMFAILFIGSIIILLLGIIGEYLARIYMEVKNRPIYIAKDERLDENTELKD